MDKQEIVVITGASAGVGRAVAMAFAKRKAKIGLIARDQERLKSTAEEVRSQGGDALIFPLDVAESDSIEAAATEIENHFGPIGIWINNAMVSVFSRALEMNAQEYKRVTDVTYLGVVHGTLSALKRMVPRDHGRIIQVGSALAYRGIPLQSAYCAAKHAVQGFTESIRCELLHDKSNVKISMVQLPALNTPQFNWVKSRLPRRPQPVPPIFQPEVAADAIVWAAHHYRREWYVGGSTLLAIIGNKLFPHLGDRYLAKKGYRAQQYDGKIDKERPHNLFNSVPGSFGAHGEFDKRAKKRSVQVIISRYRIYFLGALILLFLALNFWFSR